MNENVHVLLPKADEDIIYVFSHILNHFFKEGIGLRQICDWCRLLWIYNQSIDHNLLEKRLRNMGVMTEWKAFAALAVDYLGMPLYTPDKKWKRKADKIVKFIIKTGNFGHNRDYSFYQKQPFIARKITSFWRHNKDIIYYFSIFPKDSLKLWVNMVANGIKEGVCKR